LKLESVTMGILHLIGCAVFKESPLEKKMKQFLLILILANALSVNSVHATQQKVYVEVNGLVCDFCARALEKVFSKQESVSGIDVNLDKKVITIDLKDNAQIEDAKIAQLVNDAGYSVIAIRHSSEQDRE